MQGASKKSKRGGKFSSPPGARQTQVISVNFAYTTNHIRVSWPQNWEDMYEFINTATETTKFPPRMIQASDESETDDEVFNEELLRL